jgi:hypothetical protein
MTNTQPIFHNNECRKLKNTRELDFYFYHDTLSQVNVYRLLYIWKQETSFHSSIEKKIEHWAFQMLVSYGKDCLPYLFQAKQHARKDLFFHLFFYEIIPIDEQPKFENRGYCIDELEQIYIEWGKEKGYI